MSGTQRGRRSKTDVDAVVVGAGFAGVYLIHKMTSMGLTVRGFEKGTDVGGTWYWNKYPGARCDIESLEYSYGFADEIQQNWDWSHRYAEQPEIQRYISFVADKFDIRKHISFETRVVSQTYDERSQTWTVTTDKGETLTCRFCLMATGNLSTPRFPDLPGLETYEGEKYHSGQWPAEGVDFTGKRVALIGTGATGVQITPKVAKQADHLFVLQRTANFSVPAEDRPLDEEELEGHRKDYAERRNRARRHNFGLSNVPEPTRAAMDLTVEECNEVFERLWQQGGSVGFLMSFSDLLKDPEANERCSEFVRNKIRSIVKDPETAEKLCPHDHPIGSKRLCVDTGYYETYNRDNVELVDLRSNPIKSLTPKGIRTEAGEIEVDAIIFATGFDAMTGALTEIDITGRGGLSLKDKWEHGPLTYLGFTINGFPNLFLVTGPGSPSVKSNMALSIEQHVELIARTVEHLEKNRIAAIEPTAEAEAKWVAHVNEVAEATLYVKADSWYLGSNIPGKPRVFMPYVGGVNTYREACEKMVNEGFSGFVMEPAREPAKEAVAAK